MAKVGFVGLGVMGSQMVNRLLSKGHTVTGYNRTRAKAQWLVEKGMQWADSPAPVASASDVTFAMVTNAAAIQAITEGPDGLLAGLSAGKIFIDMSTVSPDVSRALAAKVREQGRGHGGRSGIRKCDHAAARQAFGHGGRAQRDVREDQASAAGYRAESDARRRQRACACP